MITNASFRTKKLPDDITVAQVAEAAAAAAAAAAATTSISTGTSQNSPSTLTVQLGSITEENDEPSGVGVKSSFRLSELVKKKSKPKPTRNKVNGGVSQDGQGGHPHSAENNGGVVSNSTDWISDSCESKEEVEMRRRSNEFNGSTQV